MLDNNMIVTFSLCLLFCISIILIVARKWNKENHQQSLRETMKDNIKEAKRILDMGKKKDRK